MEMIQADVGEMKEQSGERQNFLFFHFQYQIFRSESFVNSKQYSFKTK